MVSCRKLVQFLRSIIGAASSILVFAQESRSLESYFRTLCIQIPGRN